MGINSSDIAAQRAMLERGEEKRKAIKRAEDRERLRDTFAAAALTGFIRGMPSDSIFHLGLMAKQSYEVADAMIRERLRQFDRSQPIKPADATPAAHATPCEGSLQGEGTLPTSYRDNDEKRGVSDTKRGPVAWAVRYKPCDTGVVALCRTLAECRDQWSNRATDHWRYVPLYSHPQSILTNEEREAIYRAEARLRTAYVPDDQTAATLRKLLERLK
jgi:hypothetical protein